MRLTRFLQPILALSLMGCFDHVNIGEGLSSSGSAGQPADSSVDVSGSGGTQDGSLPEAFDGDSAAGGAGGTPGDTGMDDAHGSEEGGAGGSGGGGDGAAGAAAEAGPGQSCGTETCAPGTECCYAKATCFDPKENPDACEAPAPDGAPGKPCAADSHCAPGEYCRNDNDFMCMGKGRCMARTQTACAQMLGNPTCACDGVTRPQSESCQLGVRTLSSPKVAGCGDPVFSAVRAFCGNDPDWCPAGWLCCGITGLCYDPAEPALCTFPSDGAYLPCVNSLDCPPKLGVCQGPSCGAPGGCVHRPWQCDGVDAPVCGCDGAGYINEMCALQNGAAVKHAGPCVDGGT